jgi:hypothetical protein
MAEMSLVIEMPERLIKHVSSPIAPTKELLLKNNHVTGFRGESKTSSREPVEEAAALPCLLTMPLVSCRMDEATRDESIGMVL